MRVTRIGSERNSRRTSPAAAEAERSKNRTYRVLASLAVAEAAREAGDLEEAILYFGRASNLDPLSLQAARPLQEIALEACREGDLETAADAWLNIRGPGEMKTPAQYANSRIFSIVRGG